MIFTIASQRTDNFFIIIIAQQSSNKSEIWRYKFFKCKSTSQYVFKAEQV